jgi:hypothetical protein
LEQVEVLGGSAADDDAVWLVEGEKCGEADPLAVLVE